jgi:hypothetical protein
MVHLKNVNKILIYGGVTHKKEGFNSSDNLELDDMYLLDYNGIKLEW